MSLFFNHKPRPPLTGLLFTPPLTLPFFPCAPPWLPPLGFPCHPPFAHPFTYTPFCHRPCDLPFATHYMLFATCYPLYATRLCRRPLPAPCQTHRRRPHRSVQCTGDALTALRTRTGDVPTVPCTHTGDVLTALCTRTRRRHNRSVPLHRRRSIRTTQRVGNA